MNLRDLGKCPVSQCSPVLADLLIDSAIDPKILGQYIKGYTPKKYLKLCTYILSCVNTDHMYILCFENTYTVFVNEALRKEDIKSKYIKTSTLIIYYDNVCTITTGDHQGCFTGLEHYRNFISDSEALLNISEIIDIVNDINQEYYYKLLNIDPALFNPIYVISKPMTSLITKNETYVENRKMLQERFEFEQIKNKVLDSSGFYVSENPLEKPKTVNNWIK